MTDPGIITGSFVVLAAELAGMVALILWRRWSR